MTTLRKLKAQYTAGSLNKQDFIKQAHDIHETLFEYAEMLNETNISEICITDNDVIMKTRDTDIRLHCSNADRRIAPIETLNFNYYEKTEIQTIEQVIKENYKDSFTFYDVGANIGYYSLVMSKLFTEMHIFAFEPIPATYELLKKNIELNNSANIKIHNFGFFTDENVFPFFYYPEGSGNASLRNLSESYHETLAVETVECSVKRLDDFHHGLTTGIDFIKCDVEGAELFVFQGGLETIKEFRPIVFTEMLRKWSSKFDYHPNEIIALFREIGYETYKIGASGIEELDEITDDTLETNFIFLDPTKHNLPNA